MHLDWFGADETIGVGSKIRLYDSAESNLYAEERWFDEGVVSSIDNENVVVSFHDRSAHYRAEDFAFHVCEFGSVYFSPTLRIENASAN